MPFRILESLGTRKYINILGVNSGTSADGLDLALVRLGGMRPDVILTKTYRFRASLRDRIIAAGEPEFADGIEWLRLDAELGTEMGKLAAKFVKKATAAGHRINLVAMHGQTVRHLPETKIKTTYQIGDPNRLAAVTKIPVVSDFRRADIAVGGEGAPLSSILHEVLFRDPRRWRAVVNIGGIANVTVLPPMDSRIPPFAGDCGPGNMIIDRTMMMYLGRRYDRSGKVAASGRAYMGVVENVMGQPFFSKKPPKSTGRELFGAPFLKRIVSKMGISTAQDIVATVTEITIGGIVKFITEFSPAVKEILICGGGVHNEYIHRRLTEMMPGKRVMTTEALGYDPDYLEAVLWAYLGFRFVKERPIIMKNYTGAGKAYIPGRLCLP
jgi:anhydro-N-acetylmuramic acid kinase